jgi:5-methylcytosine-specific restriction enzyme A
VTLKPCVQCGEPSSKSRCPEHRPKDAKPPREQRGYDHHWKKLSRQARRLQPFCSDCGTTEGLEGDHSPEAWTRKAAGLTIRLEDIDVLCGPCNRRRGSARPAATRGDAPSAPPHPPRRKAKFELHTPRGFV